MKPEGRNIVFYINGRDVYHRNSNCARLRHDPVLARCQERTARGQFMTLCQICK